MALILGIESTCDETAAAVVADGYDVRSNVVATQVDLHAKYRGVVPEIASRAHIENILPVLREALTAEVGLTPSPGTPGEGRGGGRIADEISNLKPQISYLKSEICDLKSDIRDLKSIDAIAVSH